MITEAQSYRCVDCKFHRYYFSPIAPEFDEYTCLINGTPSLHGCSKFQQG